MNHLKSMQGPPLPSLLPTTNRAWSLPFPGIGYLEAVAVGLLCGEVVSIWFEHNIHLIFYSTLIADSFTSQNLDRQFDLCTLCLIDFNDNSMRQYIVTDLITQSPDSVFPNQIS